MTESIFESSSGARVIKQKKRRGSMFWGLVFLAIGGVLLLNYMFGINLPLIRIMFSLGIIYLGVKLMFSSFDMRVEKIASSNQAVFSKSRFAFDQGKSDQDYDTVFGESVLDLSDLDLGGGSKEIAMNTVFGKTEVILKEGTPFIIESEAIFGSIKSPERKLSGFGENNFSSPNFDSSQPHIRLKTAAVFGEVRVRFVN